jgi:hypothetical protein
VPVPARPKASHADVLLRESQVLLAPLARLLVAHGVTYPQLAQALKRLFLDAARAELAAAGKAGTDSALSLLSGVHRKDVRALARGSARVAAGGSRTLPLAAEVFTRWANDRRYADARGAPAALPLRGRGARTFDALVRSVSKDFHPHSVLEELRRLGLAEVDGERVRLKARGFVPQQGFGEVAYYVAANVRDHLAAAAANLRRAAGSEPPFLEHAVYADELSARSAAQLHKLARRLWAAALKRMYRAATNAVEADRALPAAQRSARMRFGAYYFADIDAAPPPAARIKGRSRK